MATFQETVDYLYSRLPAYHRVGNAAIKKDLGNTLALCHALGNPHKQFQSIHVAGTNGKGSVSSMLASICMEAGFQRVGLYTSPHLKSFTERIRLNGVPVPEQWVVNFVNDHKGLIESIEPSFFELTVAMCFRYFAENEVDIAVVEVGMGGRLDSTNVINPCLSVITAIGFDHKEFLGDTLAKIAGEKAGIIKPGVPVVVGQAVAETRPVFERVARENDAPVVWAETAYGLVRQPSETLDAAVYHVYRHEKIHLHRLWVDLVGNYQMANIRTALAATDVLAEARGIQITEEHLRRGFANVRRNSGLMGRMQVLGRAPLVLVDVAHNVDGISAVVEQANLLKKGQLYIIFGLVMEKDVEEILPLLPKQATYYWVKPPIPRGLPAAELKLRAAKFGLNGSCLDNIPKALLLAQKVAQPDDLILVTGSFFVAAEVL